MVFGEIELAIGFVDVEPSLQIGIGVAESRLISGIVGVPRRPVGVLVKGNELIGGLDGDFAVVRGAGRRHPLLGVEVLPHGEQAGRYC